MRNQHDNMTCLNVQRITLRHGDQVGRVSDARGFASDEP
jgi:hypothetical protein